MLCEIVAPMVIKGYRKGGRKLWDSTVAKRFTVDIPEVQSVLDVALNPSRSEHWVHADGQIFYVRETNVLTEQDDCNPFWSEDRDGFDSFDEAAVKMREVVAIHDVEAGANAARLAQQCRLWEGKVLTPSRGPHFYLEPSNGRSEQPFEDHIMRVEDCNERTRLRSTSMSGEEAMLYGRGHSDFTVAAPELLTPMCGEALVIAAREFVGPDMPSRSLNNYPLKFLGTHVRYMESEIDRDQPSDELADILAEAIDTFDDNSYRNRVMKELICKAEISEMAVFRWEDRQSLSYYRAKKGIPKSKR